MDISIFDVIGPIMIGPSSSHTAGAARLSFLAREIVKQDFTHISFGLYGSFARTYLGHGTDKALVAGALGLSEQDERIADAFTIAKERHLTYDFYEADLPGMHENTVQMTLTMADGSSNTIIGSSIGGGQVVINQINGFTTDISFLSPTILIFQKDQKGVVSEISHIIATHNINIATMRVSRQKKGDVACCVIETDDRIPLEVEQEIAENKNILNVKVIN